MKEVETRMYHRMSSYHFLFVINFLSGSDRNKDGLIKSIAEMFPEAHIFVIKSREDFDSAIKLSQEERFKYIIISGGDGTIHSFLSVIIEQNKVLGILPSGSGNGLARSLNIPLSPIMALKRICNERIVRIDVGKLQVGGKDDGRCYYFSSAIGFGVDAFIAHRFEQQKIRGLFGYVLAGMKEFFQYRPIHVWVQIDDTLVIEDDFLIFSIMNIPQYGNNFYLVPSARLNDGALNVVGLKKKSMIWYAYALYQLLRRKETYPMMYFRAKQVRIEIKGKKKGYYHIDGEPRVYGDSSVFEVKVMPGLLSVFC